jgi:hypothetical protein
MKNQIMILCAASLLVFSACNKSDTVSPCSYGGPCGEPNKEDMPGSSKPGKQQRTMTSQEGTSYNQSETIDRHVVPHDTMATLPVVPNPIFDSIKVQL